MVGLDLLQEKGVPLEQQHFDWRDLVRFPTSKLDDDAFTRVRIILMSAVEQQALRLQHSCARTHHGDRELVLALTCIRRIEQHQQILVRWLLPPDLSPLETTIAHEQMEIEVTAAAAAHEPDAYVAQTLRFGLVEDLDHLFRYSALFDRLEGGDANSILQGYTEVREGRPTALTHRAPEDDLRLPYDQRSAAPESKLDVYTVLAAAEQARELFTSVGPQLADPLARQLYAEIASVEEQHVTQYESLIDPNESWLARWLIHEATEVYNYESCRVSEGNEEVRRIWERFVAYELGHLHAVMELLSRYERRDPAGLLPAALPPPLAFVSHRALVTRVLEAEGDLTARGTGFVPMREERADTASVAYRNQMNSRGAPSDLVARGYAWAPGTEAVHRRATPRSEAAE